MNPGSARYPSRDPGSDLAMTGDTKPPYGGASEPPAMTTETPAAGTTHLTDRAPHMPVRSPLATRLGAFGVVGGLAFLIDLGVYNLVRLTVLDGSPIWSKVVSVAVATAFAWWGNRTLTFRATRGRPSHHEFVLFVLANVIGLLIAAACLFVSHYVLGLRSPLADNISGNVVGLVLGTLFRFYAYDRFVFRKPVART